MGKKIQNIGRYVMDGVALGKGNFARVELATHGVTHAKVSYDCHGHCTPNNCSICNPISLMEMLAEAQIPDQF